MLLLLLIFLCLSLTASSSRLAVAQHPSQQLPSVARVDKPYSWSLSPGTFTSTNNSISYSTSKLPSWLTFDSQTQTFHGTPSENDQGYPKITITAKDRFSTVSASFTLCVTGDPEPVLRLPISHQFSAPAPSLSSVFIMSPHSGIPTDSPALRIPPKWSFSIGFEYDMFTSNSNLYYAVRNSDRTTIDSWMTFDTNAITLNGVTPKESDISQPAIKNLLLCVSDQEGYSSSCLPFAIVLSQHELSLGPSSRIINIGTNTFSFDLASQTQNLGILVDGRQIESNETKTLSLDTSRYDWLRYDNASHTLSGDVANIDFGSQRTIPLCMTLEAYNQYLLVPISLSFEPSYFSTEALPAIQGFRGEAIDYDLKQYFSDASRDRDTQVLSTFDPSSAGSWLSYDHSSARLTGKVPFDFSGEQIVVTFTHSSSYAKLHINFGPPRHTKENFRPLGMTATAHMRLVLGLGITFGTVGGLCFVGGLLALFRHCARVEDTAIGGEEGRNVWSEQDKRWYAGHGCAHEIDANLTEKPRLGDYRHPHAHGDLGLGLRRVSERSQSEGEYQIPGVMSKREFFSRLRDTVRVVSDQIRGRKSSRQHPVIGRPILQQAPDENEPAAVVSSSTFFEQAGLPSHPGSTIMSNSPSTSTAEHSIPRRRADFAPPRSPAPAHTRLSRQLSSGSSASNTSEKMHASEAVVQTASKAMSINSGKSFITGPPMTENVRPRLVPFTSASRVPVPRQPPGLQEDGRGSTKRVNSQTAKVWRRNPADGLGKGNSNDELKMGLHYVQSLGADPQPIP